MKVYHGHVEDHCQHNRYHHYDDMMCLTYGCVLKGLSLSWEGKEDESGRTDRWMERPKYVCML